MKDPDIRGMFSEQHPIKGQWDALQFKHFFDTNKLMRQCPYCGCSVMVDEGATVAQSPCPDCGKLLCAKCGGQAHRHDICCNAIEAKIACWKDWQDIFRASYFLAMPSLAAAQNLLALKQDEEQKAKTCRHCPHCQRLVEHIGGCSSMVCGQDAHGGNIQNGCHKRFRWSEARPYQADLVCLSEREMALLEQASTQNQCHPGITCHMCGKTGFHGMRFRCIRCEVQPGISIDICAECTLVSGKANPCGFDNPHEFEIVQGKTGSVEQQPCDPRFSDWGSFVYPLHDEDCVWVALHADPDPWNFRLQLPRMFLQLQEMLECEAGLRLFQAELGGPLGQQLRRRYRICGEGAAGPAVAAMDPKTHQVLATWVGEDRVNRLLRDPGEALCEFR